ncbi:MAG TPA: T9SS type A sorting domain-containing protein, partial [Bacteroidales bacterium]|nr:T9SS type A sorting domain-containing protein [Bacteroidales bacterium]
LVDHRWGENFELPCTQTDVYIANNDTTTLSINYHLLPHEAPITSDLNVNSDRVSRFTTTVPNGKTFRVATNTNIDMYNSEIHIEAGGNLTLFGNNTITARRGTCKLVIDGSISVGGNVNFIAEEGAELQILLNNNDLSVTFPSTHFTRCKLISKAQDITFNAALFDHCGAVTAYRGNVNAVNSTGFDNSYLRLEHLGSSSNQFMATIDGCSFNTDELMPAIFLVRYGKYLIQNDSIRGFSNGIQLFYSGGGQSGYQKIMNNNIRNSTLTGVKIYTSTGVMSGTNYIHGNNFGIQLFNTCNVLLAGNPNATGTSSTQKIADNTSYEFYATNGSFPAYFKYNAIIDDNNQGNPTDPLLYYDNANCQPSQVFNVAYNYWGTSFNAASDLKLNCGTFNWMPVWYPGGNPSASAVEDLYMEASSQFENGNYNQAVLLFQLLIEQYPTSSYAQAAMKELLRLESFAGSDYDSLKVYYLTENTIINDSTLSKLGAFLANKCDVELGNWENAIAWYENQILNPTSSADSIFAIIDLGDIYLLMQNQGLKSSYVGKLAQYKPESKEQYAVNRDYLLSLFPFEKNQNNADPDIAGNNPGFLNQNSPNPFSESTQINYSITRAGNVDISVRNLTGQEIICLPQGTKETGSYSVDFVNLSLPSGFYFFSLKLDGNVIATRKMCVSS